MATLKQRLHRKNSSGTYDAIHLETGADCITGTLDVAHGGTGRATLTSGYFLRGNSTGAVTMSSVDQVKSALGINNDSGIYRISYAIKSSNNYRFDITDYIDSYTAFVITYNQYNSYNSSLLIWESFLIPIKILYNEFRIYNKSDTVKILGHDIYPSNSSVKSYNNIKLEINSNSVAISNSNVDMSGNILFF